MLDTILWILALIVLLGTLVMFHEFGHFAVAKLFRVRVDEFAFGFGPKWIRLFKKGDTEYTIHPIPLGGFVKLGGEEPGGEELPGAFVSKPWWQRYLVYLAGPFMSFALAYLVFCTLGMAIGLQAPNGSLPRIDLVVPDSQAERIGLKSGDVIKAINGTPILTGKQMLDTIRGGSYQNLRIELEREGKMVTVHATPKPSILESEKMGFEVSLRMMKSEDNVNTVGYVKPGGLADRAGLKPMDVIVSIGGVRLDTDKGIYDAAKLQAKRLSVVVSRGESTMLLNLDNSARDLKAISLIGFMPTPTYERVGFMDSIRAGNHQTYGYGKALVTMLFSRHVKDTVGGPLAIADQTAIAVKRGAYGYLQLMAMLSLSLGVVNLLPIPVMDGGQMTLLLGEAVIRRRLSTRTMEIATKIGLAVIAVIFILVMYVDLARLFEGKLLR